MASWCRLRQRSTNRLFVLGFLFSATLLIVAQASRPNFSGRWQLDKSRSDFGSLPPDDSAMELIEHQEPKLTIAQVWRNSDGEHTVVWQLTTDGAENLTRMNETEVASRTIWEDGRLITEWRVKRGGQPSEGKYDRSLSEDRKTMTVGVHKRSAANEINQHLVFVESAQ